jgi:polyhydroxybutyrate depolymerase
MSDISEQRNFIVAYPEGLSVGVGASWNAGACCANKSDDVGFIRDLVKELESDYCIDPKRVFATGLSNGAMLSYRLACEMADTFAAVAPVAGAVQVPCHPSRPVPILAFHGTGDNIVPFNGGADGIYHVLHFPPVAYSIDLWRELDSCPGASAQDDASAHPMANDSTPDGGPNPALFAGSTEIFHQGTASCHEWSGCADHSEVEFCTVVGGAHAWPGAPGATPDIDASSVILDFFDKHPMP